MKPDAVSLELGVLYLKSLVFWAAGGAWSA